MNKASTSTTLASSTNPTVFGQATTFTATISVTAPGSASIAGTVSFLDGSTTLGTETVTTGTATFSDNTLSVGNHSITATFSGNTDLAGSSSAALTQVVDKASTTTTLASSFNPALFGQQLTFTATVSPVSPGAGEPTGSVLFEDGSTTLGTVTLSSGQASVTVFGMTAGSHSLTAVYDGDTNFTGSSGATTQTVNAVTGIPFAAAKGQDFSGAAATFAPLPGTTLTDYSATVYWGDGSSSVGSITAAGSLDRVSASHTYVEEGPYLPSVEIDDPALGARGAALDYALVVPLMSDTSFANVVSWSLGDTGSVTLESGDTGSYNLQAGGNLDYTLTTTTDSIGATATDTTTGTLGFSVAASVSTTGSLTQGTYTTSATGGDTLGEQALQGDLSSLSTGTASGGDIITNLSGTGNGSTGSFTWTWNETTSRDTTWQGTSSDGTTAETDSSSGTVSNSAAGNYGTGAFSRTETDISTTTHTPTGNDWGDVYTATTTQSSTSGPDRVGHARRRRHRHHRRRRHQHHHRVRRRPRRHRQRHRHQQRHLLRRRQHPGNPRRLQVEQDHDHWRHEH